MQKEMHQLLHMERVKTQKLTLECMAKSNRRDISIIVTIFRITNSGEYSYSYTRHHV
jgi:hypothetical protein